MLHLGPERRLPGYSDEIHEKLRVWVYAGSRGHGLGARNLYNCSALWGPRKYQPEVRNPIYHLGSY